MSHFRFQRLPGLLAVLGFACIPGAMVFKFFPVELKNKIFGGFLVSAFILILLSLLAKAVIVTGKEERKEARWHFLFALTFFGLFALVVAGIAAYFELPRRAYRDVAEPHRAHVDDYVFIRGLKDQSQRGNPYIAGKVVMVDVVPDSESRSDSLKGAVRPRVIGTDYLPEMPWQSVNAWEFFELSPDLRATTPEEVGTIIWLKWGQILEGQYGKGIIAHGAFRITCDVTVIDRDTRTVVARRAFTGGAPPKSKRLRDRESKFGSRPTKQIVEYIESLPRREWSQE